MPSMQHLGTFNIECSKNETFVSVHCPLAYGNHRLTLLLSYTSEIPLDATYFNALTHAILHAEVRVVVWDLLLSLTSRSSGNNYAFARISTKKQPPSKHLPKVPSRFILLPNMQIQELYPKGLTAYVSACPPILYNSVPAMLLPTCTLRFSHWKSSERRSRK